MEEWNSEIFLWKCILLRHINCFRAAASSGVCRLATPSRTATPSSGTRPATPSASRGTTTTWRPPPARTSRSGSKLEGWPNSCLDSNATCTMFYTFVDDNENNRMCKTSFVDSFNRFMCSHLYMESNQIIAFTLASILKLPLLHNFGYQHWFPKSNTIYQEQFSIAEWLSSPGCQCTKLVLKSYRSFA